jgi:hypothetical protein
MYTSLATLATAVAAKKLAFTIDLGLPHLSRIFQNSKAKSIFSKAWGRFIEHKTKSK